MPPTPAWPQHTSSTGGLYPNSSAGLYATSSVGLHSVASVEVPLTPAGGTTESSVVALDYASVLRLLVSPVRFYICWEGLATDVRNLAHMP